MQRAHGTLQSFSNVAVAYIACCQSRLMYPGAWKLPLLVSARTRPSWPRSAGSSSRSSLGLGCGALLRVLWLSLHSAMLLHLCMPTWCALECLKPSVGFMEDRVRPARLDALMAASVHMTNTIVPLVTRTPLSFFVQLLSLLPILQQVRKPRPTQPKGTILFENSELRITELCKPTSCLKQKTLWESGGRVHF